MTPILLTGVFVPEAVLEAIWGYGGGVAGFVNPMIEQVDEQDMKNNIALFEKRCLDNGIDFRVHRDTSDFALNELKLETCFADVIIIGSEKFYKDLGVDSPNDYSLPVFIDHR